MYWTSFEDETHLDFYYLLNTGERIIPEHPYRKNSKAFQINVPYLIGTTDDEGRGRINFDWLSVTIDKTDDPWRQLFYTKLSPSQFCFWFVLGRIYCPVSIRTDPLNTISFLSKFHVSYYYVLLKSSLTNRLRQQWIGGFWSRMMILKTMQIYL